MKLHVRHYTRLLASATTLLLLATLASGCGKAAEKASETIIESNIPGGGSVDINSDDGMITIETPEGNVQAGESVALPDNFPEDIPIPEGVTWNLVQNISSDGATGVTAQGMLSQTVAEVANFIKTEAAAKNWTTVQSFQQAGEMEMHTFSKGERNLHVTISHADDQTALVISSQ